MDNEIFEKYKNEMLKMYEKAKKKLSEECEDEDKETDT